MAAQDCRDAVDETFRVFPKIFNVDVFDRLGIYRCARRWTFMEAGLSRIKKVLAVMSNAETRGTHVLGWLHS